MSRDIDVLVLGGAGVDTIVYVPELPLPQMELYGRQARIILAGDTRFLSLFPDAGKSSRPAAPPRPGRPYQCTLQGG
ncbi:MULTISPECIES: hypothetical protein [Streptomyces]|uniref:Uncharacterized protein n=1 Tax=Streptomyces sviceus (strain ATCC 29083 / DSM 924 / JCM 4929 / NBRC 13980 / NCIMB 11184 / NRRL 5439 / UC 5370) TaxID=463191 RepID=B5HST6_STRX2|nr:MULTISPECIES: hypothetical protein [Streptomyces]EDY55891.1 conserved hypothetical protein [Streptomyces sviceus ATCC 29083]MYT09776.1 hypothetical protein [Streptomyces sp. SID5470]